MTTTLLSGASLTASRWDSDKVRPVFSSTQGIALSASIPPPRRSPLEETENAGSGTGLRPVERCQEEGWFPSDLLTDQVLLGDLSFNGLLKYGVGYLQEL
jgi:hypothetical protein